MNTRFTYLILFLLLYSWSCAFAQKSDSIKLSTIGGDTNKQIVKSKPRHSPAKAAIFSAVLPGLGQAYNHKFWKIPIIYAGIGVFTYFIIHNWQQYNTFQSAIGIASQPQNGGIDPAYPAYSISDLTSARDYYHRYRDLSVIGATVFYVLNIVDAEVDAQMFSFNVSDDLSMRLTPTLNTYATVYGIGLAPSLSLQLNLK